MKNQGFKNAGYCLKEIELLPYYTNNDKYGRICDGKYYVFFKKKSEGHIEEAKRHANRLAGIIGTIATIAGKILSWIKLFT